MPLETILDTIHRIVWFYDDLDHSSTWYHYIKWQYHPSHITDEDIWASFHQPHFTSRKCKISCFRQQNIMNGTYTPLIPETKKSWTKVIIHSLAIHREKDIPSFQKQKSKSKLQVDIMVLRMLSKLKIGPDRMKMGL